MDSENKHIIYTAGDIQNYLSGKLGPAEMHAIEKAALDDPFLAEAMEGYATMQEKDWKNQLRSLKANFTKEKTTKVIAMQPSTTFTRWKVAAAIFIIVASAGITYMLTTRNPSQNEYIAAVKTKQDSVNLTSEVAVNIDTANGSTSSTTPGTKIARPPLTTADQKTLADSEFLYRPGTIDKSEEKQVAGGGYVEDQLKDRIESSTNNAVASAPQNRVEKSEIKSNKMAGLELTEATVLQGTAAKAERKFVAQVVGPDNRPLPFASISTTHEKLRTYADANGNFQLASSDSLLNIEIKSAGYISRNFTLNSNQLQNKIVLTEASTALKENRQAKEEVVVIGYGTRRRAALTKDSVTIAEPVDGWDKYHLYITNNLIIPGEALQKNIHGEVEVYFEVRMNGVISNMKISKPLCDECDEAAMRLIKNGPRWKVKNGIAASAKVVVKF